MRETALPGFVVSRGLVRLQLVGHPLHDKCIPLRLETNLGQYTSVTFDLEKDRMGDHVATNIKERY